jgi:hypothetical protein
MATWSSEFNQLYTQNIHQNGNMVWGGWGGDGSPPPKYHPALWTSCEMQGGGNPICVIEMWERDRKRRWAEKALPSRYYIRPDCLVEKKNVRNLRQGLRWVINWSCSFTFLQNPKVHYQHKIPEYGPILIKANVKKPFNCCILKSNLYSKKIPSF